MVERSVLKTESFVLILAAPDIYQSEMEQGVGPKLILFLERD